MTPKCTGFRSCIYSVFRARDSRAWSYAPYLSIELPVGLLFSRFLTSSRGIRRTRVRAYDLNVGVIPHPLCGELFCPLQRVVRDRYDASDVARIDYFMLGSQTAGAQNFGQSRHRRSGRLSHAQTQIFDHGARRLLRNLIIRGGATPHVDA